MSNPISRTKVAGNLLFLTGLTGDGEGIEAQTRSLFEKMKKTLEENGLSMKDVVNGTVYLTDINDRPTHFNPIWKEYFPKDPPTRTCVQIASLGPQKKVEVTVIALIP